LQRAAVFKDRQVVLPAMKKPIAAFYRFVDFVCLSFDGQSGRRQHKEQQGAKDSISHSSSFSLEQGELIGVCYLWFQLIASHSGGRIIKKRRSVFRLIAAFFL
jgi:hypothetical protein